MKIKVGRIKEIIKEEIELFLLETKLQEIIDSKDWVLRRPLKEWYIPVNPGTKLKSSRAFRPVYHGYRFSIPTGHTFEVQGAHPPGKLDQDYGVPNPVSPEDRGPRAGNIDNFTRVRLDGLDGAFKGQQIFINPFELKKFFEEDDYLENPQMPGEWLPPGEKDPKVTQTIDVPVVKPQPINPDEETTQYDGPIVRKAKPRE